MVHSQVRPALSVTYWLPGVLFVCVTFVLPHPFVCARSWRASVSCLARFPGAHLVLCVNSSRAVVVGGGARVGFAVDAESVDGLDESEAARLLTRRLRSDAVRDRDSGLRASDGASLWARGSGSEDDRVVLSVVGRDGSRVTLGDACARRVLAGRPSASEWDVESMLGEFDAAFERGAGAWAADAGDVVLPPSGWDDDMVPAVDDDDE